jgi:hypothetical protein
VRSLYLFMVTGLGSFLLLHGIEIDDRVVSAIGGALVGHGVMLAFLFLLDEL